MTNADTKEDCIYLSGYSGTVIDTSMLRGKFVVSDFGVDWRIDFSDAQLAASVGVIYIAEDATFSTDYWTVGGDCVLTCTSGWYIVTATSGAGRLTSYTVDYTDYSFVSGMTWAQFMMSEYGYSADLNIGSGALDYMGSSIYNGSTIVRSTDTIDETATYTS